MTPIALAMDVEVPGEGQDLLAAARAGDMAAFDRLMRQHERLVLATALRITGDLEDAKDVSQEVFLRFYRHLGKLRAPETVPAWLYRVTVNACHDLRKRRPAPAAIEEANEIEDPAPGPQASAFHNEYRRALELSLRRLPEKERAALVLRELEGLSTEEVARALGSSEATVRSQVSKARVKVHEFLERYFRPRKEDAK